MSDLAAVIKQVILEQHPVKLPVDFVERNAYQRLKSYATLPEIVVITGLRRVGKSTLMQQLRNESSQSDYYINFDDDRLVNFKLDDFQTLFELFVELYGIQNTFYFDEIQNIPGWEIFVRRLHDQGKKIYITGSNATLFSQELGSRLTGRYLQINLFPYSFSEIWNHQYPELAKNEPITTEQRGMAAKAFAEYRQSGGIPSYFHWKEVNVLHILYESVLYRDIIARYKLPSDRAIKELVYYFASHVGKEFSYSALAKQIGIGSPTTVTDYSHYLAMSYLCFTVPRFSHSISKQQLSNKKCYFIDHGMARQLGFRSTEDTGRLLENLVYIELKRRGGEIYFHKEQKECDFLIRKQGKITEAVQVCFDLNDTQTRQREINGLVEAMRMHQLSTGIILTESQEEFVELDLEGMVCHITIMPIWKWAIKSE